MKDDGKIIQIPREHNGEANALAKSALENVELYQELHLKEELFKPDMEEHEMLNTKEIVEWMKPIIKYLTEGILSGEKSKPKK